MALSRVVCITGLTLVTMMPAAADVSLDIQCNSLWNMIRSEAKQCGAEGGAVASADVRRCLSGHSSDLIQTATACVNAAQADYAAAATLQGYDADRELLAGATFLTSAAEANIYLDRRDLASAQLDSTIKIASRVKADPHVGDLAGMASGQLAVSRVLQHELTSSR